MAIVVIGGQSHNIGKTSVVCALISALPERRWTAIKITQSDHDLCVAGGGPCECETADHAVAISEERDPTAATDSSRYLAAGAVRSLWVRTRRGQLAEAMPQIHAEIARAENILFESNSILDFLKPNLYATVLNPEIPDFKPSALRYLDRANAILLSTHADPIGTTPAPTPPSVSPSTSRDASATTWPGVSAKLIAHIPTFRIAPPHYASPAFATFVAHTLAATNHISPAR